MVSIVIPDNSPSDLINAGLTKRHYEKNGKTVKVNLIAEISIKEFWTHLKEYVDKDRLLIIINVQLPSEETMSKIDLLPYEVPILYIPSELVVVTPKNKEILLSKGIAFMPPRHIYECFPNENIDERSEQWVRINKEISLEDVTENRKVNKIVMGFLRTAASNPLQAIDVVSKNDTEYMEKIGTAPASTEKQIRLTNCKIETTNNLVDAYGLIYHYFMRLLLHKEQSPILLTKNKSVITTNSPTFTDLILRKFDVKPQSKVRFGYRAAYFTDVTDKAKLCTIAGRLSQENIVIEFKKPKYVSERTLKRRLLGEVDYVGHTYRGVKDLYPSIEVKSGIIKTPKDGLENVILTLEETGTEYAIIA